MKRTCSMVAVVLVAACGGKAPAPATTPPEPGASAPLPAGPAYAALFEDGKTLTFTRVATSSIYEPDHPKANQDGAVVERSEVRLTCTITATTVGPWQAAKLACPPPREDSLLSLIEGVWIADARGVWFTMGKELPADADEAAKLADGEPLLPAQPTLVDDRSEEGEGFGEAHKISQAADGTWCVEHGSWGGDEGGWSYCFRAGLGLTKASTYFAGGMTKDDWVELVP